MAFRRYRKKKVYRPRKYRKYVRTAKRRMMRRTTRNRRDRPLIVRKEYIPGVITGSAGGIVDLLQTGAYTGALSNLNDVYDLNALAAQFEQMKVYKFILTLEPLQSEAVQSLPNAYIRKVIDNQTLAYTSESQYLFNKDCKSYPVISNRTTRHIIYPKMQLNEVYGATTITRVRSMGWFNCSQGSGSAFVFNGIAPHIYIPPMTVGVSLFNVRMTAIVGFKGNK